MKEPDWPNCTEEELWKYVASYLAKNGIDTVLVAQRYSFDRKKVKSWCAKEGAPEAFTVFEEALQKSKV